MNFPVGRAVSPARRRFSPVARAGAATAAALASGLVLGAFGASAASASGPEVSILAASYGSARVDVLAGDTVTWRNDSVRAHTVTASDQSWTSPRLGSGAVFAHRFADSGVATYYCQIHPFMRAEVDVHRLLLDAPRDAAAVDEPLELSGRAALAAGTTVSIQDAAGNEAASATVDSAGAFHATVRPHATTTYRAVSGGEASPPVQVLVLDRRVKASARAHGRRVVVNTRVLPASPGATVVLQLRLRERFGWWPVRSAKLDRNSRARFALHLRHAVRARVVLVASDGATPLARSAVVRLAPR